MRDIWIRSVGYVRGTRAVSALEYAVMAGIVIVVVGGALAAFGTNITTALSNIAANLQTTANKTGK